MKKTIAELKKRLDKVSSHQGFGTIEILRNEHLRRWLVHHIDSVAPKHIRYLIGVETLDELVEEKEGR